MKKEIIHAVHDYDLEQFLGSLGILESLLEEKIKCAICGKIIKLNNVGRIYPYKGEIKICCNNLACYKLVLENRDGVDNSRWKSPIP